MYRGSYFVLFLIAAALLGATLTYWHYTEHVFSTSTAFCYFSSDQREESTKIGLTFFIDAAFPKKEAAQLQEKMVAKISAPQLLKLSPENSRSLEDPYHSFFEAERPLEGKVEEIFLAPDSEGPNASCWVKIVGELPLLKRMREEKLSQEGAIRCQVTIDTSLPPEDDRG